MGKKSSLIINALTDFPNLLSAYLYIHKFSYSKVAADLGISASTAMSIFKVAEPFVRKQSAVSAMYHKYPELNPAAWVEWSTAQSSANPLDIKELMLFRVLDSLGLGSTVPVYLLPGNTALPGVTESMRYSGGVLKIPVTVLERNLIDALSTKAGVSRVDLIRKCLEQLAQEHPDVLNYAFKMASYEVLGQIPREGSGVNTSVQISAKARNLLSEAFGDCNQDALPPLAQPLEVDSWDSSSVATLNYVDIMDDSSSHGEPDDRSNS